jgi:hypothetical protein
MIDLDLRHHTLSTTGNRALERRSIIQPLLSYLEVKMKPASGRKMRSVHDRQIRILIFHRIFDTPSKSEILANS